jgi:hypothetical protein
MHAYVHELSIQYTPIYIALWILSVHITLNQLRPGILLGIIKTKETRFLESSHLAKLQIREAPTQIKA